MMFASPSSTTTSKRAKDDLVNLVSMAAGMSCPDVKISTKCEDELSARNRGPFSNQTCSDQPDCAHRSASLEDVHSSQGP